MNTIPRFGDHIELDDGGLPPHYMKLGYDDLVTKHFPDPSITVMAP